MLAYVIHHALKMQPDVETAVQAAVAFGWYEGHVTAEARHRSVPVAAMEAVATVAEETLPMPPYPVPEVLRRIVLEALEAYPGEALAPAAVAYAAAEAWRRGTEEGDACRGCSFRGEDPTFAMAVRTSDFELRSDFVQEEPDGEVIVWDYDYP